jgi:exonuclease SbcD
VRLLHFADLHLDAPFAWARPETARLRRRNRREVLARILQVAEEAKVDAVLSAGDLFEHDRVTPDTLEFLRQGFARSTRRIFLAPGNHDWYSARSPYALVDWPANVTVFTEPRLTPVPLADGVTLWGAAHRAPANTDGFFAGFRPDRDGVHLALAHASERMTLAWQESGKQAHAPFDADELEAAGIAHAFLGHYHVPRDAERYTYPGNADPLEFGEQGPRGIVLATLRPGGRIERERLDVAVSEVHDQSLVLDGMTHSDEVIAAVRERLSALTGCVRLTLRGEVAPSVHLDLRELGLLGEHLDGLMVRAGALSVAHDIDAIAAEPTVRGEFVRSALAEVADGELRRKVILTGLRALAGRDDLEVA